MTRFPYLLPLLAVLATGPALAQFRAVERPFMLWTEAEAQAIRDRIANDPEAKAQLEATLGIGNNVIQVQLFRAHVLQDEQARAAQKRALLSSIGRKPEPLTWDRDPATLEWNEGMPSAGDRHMRDERTEDALRYDIFYNELTPEQRAGIEAYFRSYIQFHLDGHPPRHPHFNYDRTSWLPNMHWPRPIGTHLQAVALQDEDLIRKMFESDGGWKFYFDEYLADHGFYMEEFGKFYSNTGSMIMWCEAVRKLGLDDLGYGYTGPHGRNMRHHIRANTLDIAYPATHWRGGVPSFARVTMGDAKGGAHNGALQHVVVTGYLGNGRGGNRVVSTAHMNGPMAKLHEPYWFEAAHANWPEDGYDFFLAALRKPGETVYNPSLFFNLRPVEVASVQPPRPMPSYVARERGFAFLRQDHSPTYWTGPRPAVALQFSRYYVHYVHDCLSILDYHAFNAPLMFNAWGTGRGYAGGDAWRDSVRGHSGVIVDNLRASPVARLADGTVGHRYRENLENDLDIRFAAVRADGTYPGVAHERALVLAEHYLLDVTWLRNEDPEPARTYEWQALSPMTALPGDGWAATDEVSGGALYKGGPFEERVMRGTPPDPSAVRAHDAGANPWSVRLAYQNLTEDPARDYVHGGFVDRGVGMDIHLLGEEGTRAFVGIPPGGRTDRAPPTWLMARRQAPATMFVALYTPFQNQAPVITRFERLAQNDHAVAVRIAGALPDGAPFEDVVLLRMGDDHDQELVLEQGGFRARFTDHAVVRSRDGRQTTGTVAEFRLP